MTTGIITTLAGSGPTGTGGYYGDGVRATSAELNGPIGIGIYTPAAPCASGCIYIADNNNDRIRVVNSSTGIITTVAGTGGNSYAGDGGQALNAELGNPQAVKQDSSGNLYSVDWADYRVRKVTATTGIIATVAGSGTGGYSGDGGQATSAKFSYLTDVTLDSSGNLYIADEYNMRIRKVTVTTGIITTVAGNGSASYGGDGSAAILAELYYPAGVALDSSGNLYIADEYNMRIRKVTATTGVITTYAGNGTGGYSGDGSAATLAELFYPAGVLVDSSGNLYIADNGNGAVRKVTATTGKISTFMSAANATGDPAIDSSGNIYVAANSQIVVSNGVTFGTGGNGYGGDGGYAFLAELNYPAGVGIYVPPPPPPTYYLYFMDGGYIRAVDMTTGIITTVAGNSTGGYSGDGGAATSADIEGQGVAVDSSGNIYIADPGDNRIREVTATTGIISTYAGIGPNGSNGSYGGDGGKASSAKLYSPYGVAVDGSGNLYIADTNNMRIRKVTATTGQDIYGRWKRHGGLFGRQRAGHCR